MSSARKPGRAPVRREIVATLATFDASRPRGIGETIGTYLLGIDETVTDDEILDLCVATAVRTGAIHPMQIPSVVCGTRPADPVTDAHLYVGDPSMKGHSLH